ncbi:ABC transporter ATP-binding protein [Mycoplasmopsis canis PG 14]|uniref:ABC transporter ATP-binding protein n=1 Tax=Mycoplasmopsis canis TaxID=29555 RepID=A0A449AQK5_9BACT|nr:ABC transporter ATP-binding protein [Mycoplasmopsis canis]AMD81042.1 ABC transporter ATP-binding protein [Mycoplasmopsis canis PG 14]VEU68854.1 ABC transporter ATP-binding protein [Mycoplasmopsis canis]
MLKILKKIKGKFIWFIVLSILISVFNSLISITESIAIDSVSQTFSIINKNYFLSFSILVIFIFISYLITLVINYFYYMLYNKFILYTSKSVANNFFQQYFNATYKNFENYNPETPFNNIINNASNIYEMSLVPLVSVISTAINFVFIFSYFSYRNWVLGLIIFGILILSSFSKILFFRKVKFYTEENQKSFNKLTKEVAYILDRYSVLYFANKQKHLLVFLEETVNKYCQVNYKQININIYDSELSSSILEIFKILGLILLSLFYLNNMFSISLGLIYLFIKLLSELKSEFSSLVTDIQKFLASLNLYNLLNLNLEKEENGNFLGDIKEIEFKNVSILREDKRLIENFSFKFLKGKKYLLIGESGSGKSTLVKSIINSKLISFGEILFDSKQSSSFSSREIVKKINYLEPEVFVLNKGINENIGLLDEDKIKINELLRFVEVFNDVEKELNNVNFEADNQLSLGQKQRISLARTLFSNKDILILDESLSNLDSITANKILDKLLKTEKTIIYISHHIESDFVKKFDRVLEFTDKGIKLH